MYWGLPCSTHLGTGPTLNVEVTLHLTVSVDCHEAVAVDGYGQHSPGGGMLVGIPTIIGGHLGLVVANLDAEV